MVCVSTSSVHDQSVQCNPAITDSPPRVSVLPFSGSKSQVRCTLQLEVRAICEIEHRDLVPVAVVDCGGFTRPVNAYKTFTLQPSPALDDRWLALAG